MYGGLGNKALRWARAFGFQGLVGQHHTLLNKSGGMLIVFGISEELHDHYTSDHTPEITNAGIERGCEYIMSWLLTNLRPVPDGQPYLSPTKLRIWIPSDLNRSQMVATARGISRGNQSVAEPPYSFNDIWVSCSGYFKDDEKALRSEMLRRCWLEPDTNEFDAYL